MPMAVQMTEEVIELGRDEVIGLGMDAAEAPDPPEQFVECFQLAAKAGLHRTSHASEDAPPVNITTCLDVLGCERIDHGYHILEDDAVVARCRDDGIHFTCCPTSTAMVYGWPDLTTHPINAMLEAGLLVHLNSDDPTMFRTDIGKEYVDFVGQNGYPPDVATTMVLNGVDADLARPVRQGFAAEGVRGRDRRSSTPSSSRSRDAAVMLANTDPALRRGWHVVAASDEIGRDPVQVWLLGEPWALVRLPTADGATRRSVAFADRCPHRLAPLSAGTVGGRDPAVRLPRLVLRRRGRVHGDPGHRRERPHPAARRRHRPRRPRRAGRPGVPRAGAADRGAARSAVRRSRGLPAPPARAHPGARRRRAHARQLPRHGALPVRARGDHRHRRRARGARDHRRTRRASA